MCATVGSGSKVAVCVWGEAAKTCLLQGGQRSCPVVLRDTHGTS